MIEPRQKKTARERCNDVRKKMLDNDIYINFFKGTNQLEHRD